MTEPLHAEAPRAGKSHSLRRRLLVSVMVVILFGALFQGLSAYRSALQQADTLFDYHLQQMANSLRGGPPLPMLPLEDHDADGVDYVIQIWSADGRHVFQSSRVVLPARAILGFADVTQNGVRYRVYSAQTPLQTIQIAQNMDDRNARARALAARAVLPLLIIAPLLVLALWWLINRSLLPLERTRQQVARRVAQDLTPLSESYLPDEVRPLVQEINLLFGRLHEAFDAQRAFVANAAHELRSPLTALKLQAQALERTTEPQAQQQAVARLNQGVDRAIRLMQQLLVLARQESADSTATPAQALDLGDLIRRAMEDVAALVQERALSLESDITELATRHGDPDSISVLLRNLLENAIKYTPPNGRIVIRLALVGAAPTLSVEDSGPGIPCDQRERMFGRFVRGAAQDSSGSGLGLSIARAIARRHGAILTLGQSEQLGGLKATVVFPAP